MAKLYPDVPTGGLMFQTLPYNSGSCFNFKLVGLFLAGITSFSIFLHCNEEEQQEKDLTIHYYDFYYYDRLVIIEKLL